MKMGMNSKRRKRGGGSILGKTSFDIKDDQMDKAYASYLDGGKGFWDDPTYVQFLKNLKKYENAYMLDASIEDGVYFPVKYEVDDDHLAEVKRKAPFSRRSTKIQESTSLDVHGDMQSGRENSASQNEDPQRDALPPKRRRLDVEDEVNLDLRDSGTVKEKILRRSPRTTGNSLKSLIGDELRLDVNDDSQSPLKHSSLQEEDTQTHTLVLKRRNIAGEYELNSSCKNSRFRKETTSRSHDNVFENFLDAQTKNTADKLNNKNYHRSSEEDFMPNPKVDIVNESYRQFLSCLKVDGDSVFHKDGDGRRIYYEGSEQKRSSKLEFEPQDASPFSQQTTPRTPTHISKQQNSRVVENSDDRRSSEKDCLPSAKAYNVDESYAAFLSGLKGTGDSLYYEYGGGKRVYYCISDLEISSTFEVDRRNTAAIPQSMTPRPPTTRQRVSSTLPPKPTAKADNLPSMKKDADNSKACSSRYSWFWKAIKKHLKKPFEQKEYEELWNEVNVRKPVTIHRETRGGGYPMVSQSQMGKSYLDRYPDLKREIEKVKSDPYMVLNLLRGFFFYLTKVPHGVPRPWMDKHCKKIMPARRHA